MIPHASDMNRGTRDLGDLLGEYSFSYGIIVNGMEWVGSLDMLLTLKLAQGLI